MRVASWVMSGVALMAANHALASEACSTRSGATVIPLVELYTSEGCSSCPPADRWLSRVYRTSDANFLAFHVDYWDQLGWPDRFASPTYSQRQRARVNAVGERTVYTPQVMVGAQIKTAWRSDRDFARALSRERQTAGVDIALSVASDGTTLTVDAKQQVSTTNERIQLWLAQYVDDQSTAVRTGENGGATLRHDRVVQRLWGPWALSSESVSRTISLTSTEGSMGITAFAQDGRGRVWQSLNLPLSDCKAR